MVLDLSVERKAAIRRDLEQSFEAKKESLLAQAYAQVASFESRLERRVNRVPTSARNQQLRHILLASESAQTTIALDCTLHVAKHVDRSTVAKLPQNKPKLTVPAPYSYLPAGAPMQARTVNSTPITAIHNGKSTPLTAIRKPRAVQKQLAKPAPVRTQSEKPVGKAPTRSTRATSRKAAQPVATVPVLGHKKNNTHSTRTASKKNIPENDTRPR